jgi:hypothetical protein
MGVKSVAKGIRTCALLVLTTVAITDHRDLCPAPSVGAKAGPHNSGVDASGARASRRSAPAAMRRGVTLEEPPQAQRGRPRTASAVQPGEAETPRPRLCG